MISLFRILVIGWVFSAISSAREWKSADQSKTFEAEFLKLNGGVMSCVTKSGKEISVSISKLSKEDQAWARKASEVLEKSKLDSAFRVVLVAKEGDALVRLALDSKRIVKGKDPYSGEFVLVDCKSPGARELGATETRVCNLYWSGAKKITVDKSSLTALSTDLWRQWWYHYKSRDAVLTSYHTTLESAVDSMLARGAGEDNKSK